MPDTGPPNSPTRWHGRRGMAKTPAKVPEWKPGMPSVWLATGKPGTKASGQRVVDNPIAIGAVASMMMQDYGVRAIYVHADKCSAGMTSPVPCTCSPTILRSQVTL